MINLLACSSSTSALKHDDKFVPKFFMWTACVLITFFIYNISMWCFKTTKRQPRCVLTIHTCFFQSLIVRPSNKYSISNNNFSKANFLQSLLWNRSLGKWTLITPILQNLNCLLEQLCCYFQLRKLIYIQIALQRKKFTFAMQCDGPICKVYLACVSN